MSTAHSERIDGSDANEKADDDGLISRLFNSVSFIEKVALLLLTILLSGIIVPLGINYLEGQSSLRTSVREQAAARAAALLQAQTDLLEQFSETVLTFQSLVLDVSWHGTSDVGSSQAQDKAFARYDEQITVLLTKWRAEASRARLLASAAVGERMSRFLNRVMEMQDTPINRLRKQSADAAEWDNQHAINIVVSDEANDLIAELAIEMGLTRTDYPIDSVSRQ